MLRFCPKGKWIKDNFSISSLLSHKPAEMCTINSAPGWNPVWQSRGKFGRWALQTGADSDNNHWQPFPGPVLVCGTIIQFRMLNNRCQTEERKEAFAFLLLWTLFFQSSHFFSCHDSVNRSLSFSHACCILMRDQFTTVICRAGKGPAPSLERSAPPFLGLICAAHLPSRAGWGYAAARANDPEQPPKSLICYFLICAGEKQLWNIHRDR